MIVVRRVVGESMLPGLRPGQLVVGRRFIRHVQPGMVVVVRHNGLEKIKRVMTVEPAGLELRGDNEAASTDSRHFGLVPHSAVVAKVVWPASYKRSTG